ncbi:MAG: Trk system potassium transporter TrkA [Bacteroidota bacterium]|jgi:trk system potassium uptake protein TrkA|nr:Trk system potassium transporter TrkA [Bacteroidota bacterium]
MNIIVIGAGLVGTSLAEQLQGQGHNVTVIEPNRERSETLRDKLDLRVVRGSGSNPRDLEDAGLDGAQMLIAATPVDEVNLIACMIAQQYDVTHRIARIRNADFARLQPELFGVTQVIYPEENTLSAVINLIETPHAIDAQDFAQRGVLLRSYLITAGMPIANRHLAELRTDPRGERLLVVAIIREGVVHIPRGDDTILPGDKPLFVFPREALADVLWLVSIDASAKRKVIVYGDTHTAINIAQAIRRVVESVTFIDPDLEHGNIAASRLQGIDVLHGRGDDADVLNEANVRYADFFIAAAEHNDENVLSCLLAKSEGAREVIAIVTDDQHTDLFLSIGIDHIINPRQQTANGILNSIFPGYVSAALHIQKSDIDVLRLRVTAHAPVAGRALKDSWKRVLGVSIVGAVLRDGAMIVPTGNTVLHPDDIVIVFTRAAGIRKVRKLFGASDPIGISGHA